MTAHPHCDEIARMLLERGANPYDGQVFTTSVQWRLHSYLELSMTKR